MSAQVFPLLNEIAPSWADIVTRFSIYSGSLIDTIDYAGVTWKDDVEVGEQVGASGGLVMATTTGKLTTEASATMYRAGHKKLISALADKAPRVGDLFRISLVGFDIQIEHTPPGATGIFRVHILGCRLLGRDAQYQEGVDADKVAIKLNPKRVIEFDDTGRKIVLL